MRSIPELYRVKAEAVSLGVYRTHFVKEEITETDEAEVLFGIRTITADAIRGLRINGKTVKLKGGCLHHDNGLLGSVSLYECEARKVRKLKEVGFNATVLPTIRRQRRFWKPATDWECMFLTKLLMPGEWESGEEIITSILRNSGSGI